LAKHKIAYLALSAPELDLVEQGLAGVDYDLQVHICSSEGEAIEAVKGADIILDLSVALTRRVIEEIDTAKAIVSFGHGFNHVDEVAATDHGIIVANTAGFCSEEVSDHTIMMILACAKKLTYLNNEVKAGRWDSSIRSRIVPMKAIDGSTLGLIGFGNIARTTARKAKVFGLEVIAYDPYVQPWIAREYRVELVPSMEEMASRSDFVSMHVPLSKSTEKLAGASLFKAMRSSAYFINTCRGPTVDESALIRALQTGEIAGAGIDVFEDEPTSSDNPLLKMDNVIVTPHTAGTSDASFDNGALQIGQEAARILRGTLPLSLANPGVLNVIERRPPGTNT
jgi:D-3-phosphoglycerate dehydrogenase